MNDVFHGLGIEHRHLARRPLEREDLGRGMVGALLAPGRVVHAAHRCGDPHPALLVEHGVVVVGAGVPELLVAPVGRRLQRLDAGGVSRPERLRHARIRDRHLEERHLAGLRIQDRHVVGCVFGRAVKRPVRIDGRVATVRRDQVMQVVLFGGPLPGADDEVALDPLRPRRLGLRQLALGDAIGPLAVVLERRAAEIPRQLVSHLLTGLAGLNAAHPGFFSRLELAERRRDCAGRQLAQLMTADAADVLHLLEPVGLGEFVRNAVLAVELTGLRDLQHRVPVDRRIILRGRRLVRRHHRGQVEGRARLAVHLR